VAEGRIVKLAYHAASLDNFDDLKHTVKERSIALTDDAGGDATSTESLMDVQTSARKGPHMSFNTTKKKLTRNELKERETHRCLRHLQWLRSPKCTPKLPDTDDEA
jgi:hypothetical protein